jgi:hypothetical protein
VAGTKKGKKPVNEGQLNTRQPKRLIKRVRMHCLRNDISAQQFVREAVLEKMDRDRSKLKK